MYIIIYYMTENSLMSTLPKNLIIKRKESFNIRLKNQIESIRQDRINEQNEYFDLIETKWKYNILDRIYDNYYSDTSSSLKKYRKIHFWTINRIYFSFWDKLSSNIKNNASIFISEKSIINKNPEIIITREKQHSENSYFWNYCNYDYPDYKNYLYNNLNVFKNITENFVIFNENDLNIWKLEINENNYGTPYISISLEKDIFINNLSIGIIPNTTKINFEYNTVGIYSIDADFQKVYNCNIIYIPIYDDYADCKIIFEKLINKR